MFIEEKNMQTLLQEIYSEFQSLKTIQQKIQYLDKNANNLDTDFNINIPNLIDAWKAKLEAKQNNQEQDI